MTELITKHLDKQYNFTLSTICSYSLIDKYSGERVHIKTLVIMLSKIFDISEEESFIIFDEWSDKKLAEINHIITDIQ